jgi:tricorn protease
MRRPAWVWLLVAIGLGAEARGATEARLLKEAAVSATRVAFSYAGDLWGVERSGEPARRLTAHPGVETEAVFSPDGRWLAFTGDYDGNVDVFVVAADGGEPLRLTYHPANDAVRGWTPDGRYVVFASNRASTSARYDRLFRVPAGGGFEEPLPIPMGDRISFSPDGKKLAYTALPEANATWKRYRGGRTPVIWILDLATLAVEPIPHVGATDTRPLWVGDTIYFLSDRDRVVNLFAYDTRARTVRQVTHHDDYDIHSAGAGGGAVIYEQAGWLHLLDPATGKASKLAITLADDRLLVRPRFEHVDRLIQDMAISPTGARAVFEARGEILTVPAKKGDVRNLSATAGAAERSPAWSADGQRLAYFSDAGGEYGLVLRDQAGAEPPERIDLPDPSFFYSPRWAPDGKKILYSDKRLNLWLLDLTATPRKPRLIDTDTYDHPVRSLDPVWSPDSRFIAYSKRLENHLRAIFIHALEEGRSRQVTDGMSDAISPAFDRGGKHLYFLASTSTGLTSGWLDMTSYERPVRWALYLAVLSNADPSPFAPESDEEKSHEEKKREKQIEAKGSDTGGAGKDEDDAGDEPEAELPVAEAPAPVRIDFERLDQRILAFPTPEGDYARLSAGASGSVYYLESHAGEERPTLEKYDMKERKAEPLLPLIDDYRLSQDGKKLLYRADQMYGIVDSGKAAKVGDGKLATEALEVRVEPRAEWAQMLRESWRLERDYFYDPGMHGVDWPGIWKKYEVMLPYVAHRSDLTELIADLIGELCVGHAYVGGGDLPDIEKVPVGLLGADYTVEDGLYRFARIYDGENWNPDLQAPLTQPAVEVREGDYLLAVDGKPLRLPTNIHSMFEKAAGKQVVLTVNSKPTLAGSRRVTVVPVESEQGLRNRAWVEDNRRKVDELSGGKLAYVYLPNTATAGYTSFNRYLFAQLGREGVVLDERFNGGGSAADYMVDLLRRPLLSYWATREGRDFSTPLAAIFGPKVMIINEFAGSGGDALPLYFRRLGIGRLVGKRTWGGLVGIYDYPPLLDGGFVTAPRLAIWSPDGKWEVENEGVPPDDEVEMTPQAFAAGHDPQLERAVEIAMEELKAKPVARPPRPPYPDRS